MPDPAGRVSVAQWIQVAATMVRGAVEEPGSVPVPDALRWLGALEETALEQAVVDHAVLDVMRRGLVAGRPGCDDAC